ncbi:predicted protein [Botrytis cinerea T4]|uniref:Uncharacterized protein n=1 Tax=Botryotinia fuckeliana (strain T4) TaxID=999810 RepID=G2YER7_BOTF4|nr:predicted protein [Botrytis cinerea T4]
MEKNPYSIETERLQLLRYTRDQDTSLAMSHDKLISTPTQRRYSSAVFAIFSAHKNTCRSANIVFNTGLQNFVSLRVSRMSWHKQDRSKKNPWGFEKQTPVKKKHGRVNTCDRSLKAKPIIKRAAVVAH